MPRINWSHALSDPAGTIKIVILVSWRTASVVLQRIASPCVSNTLSFRNAIARIWIGTTFAINGNILYSEPSNHHTQKVERAGFQTFILPTTSPDAMKNADTILVWCHGGGGMIGHPLQYQATYKRWIHKAGQRGKNIVILGLRYPLSPVKKWPAQRDAILELYSWCLHHSVPPSKISFGGDSAGCDFIYLTLMHMRDKMPALQQPSCVVSVSPWLDWTGAQTIGQNKENDFLWNYDEGAAIMNSTLRPDHLTFDTPDISALLATDVGRLPPQLVFFSPDEVLGSDGSRWVVKSRKAGVDITEHAAKGEMHTYAVGWPITGQKMENECDDLILNFVLRHASSG